AQPVTNRPPECSWLSSCPPIAVVLPGAPRIGTAAVRLRTRRGGSGCGATHQSTYSDTSQLGPSGPCTLDSTGPSADGGGGGGAGAGGGSGGPCHGGPIGVPSRIEGIGESAGGCSAAAVTVVARSSTIVEHATIQNLPRPLARYRRPGPPSRPVCSRRSRRFG